MCRRELYNGPQLIFVIPDSASVCPESSGVADGATVTLRAFMINCYTDFKC
jgi:hypothetical protein